MCPILSNLRRKSKYVVYKPQVNNGLAEEVMDAPSGQDNRLLTAYTWACYVHRSNRHLREELRRLLAGSLFHRVAQLKT
jgi:hypothetical protein